MIDLSRFGIFGVLSNGYTGGWWGIWLSGMGSFEELTLSAEPLGEADVGSTESSMPKQECCSGEDRNLIDPNAGGTSSPECENVVASPLKGAVGDQCEIDIYSLVTNDLCSIDGEPSSDYDGRGTRDRSPGFSQDENAVCKSALHCNDIQGEIDTNIYEANSNCESIDDLSKETTREMKEDIIAKIENDGSGQALYQEGCGRPLEVLPMSASPKHSMPRDSEEVGLNASSCTLLGVVKTVEKRSKDTNSVQTSAETDILNRVLPSQGGDVSLELINLTDEMRGCSMLVEQKVEKDICCLPGGEFMEEQWDALAGIEAKLGNQMSPLGDRNLPSESPAMISSLSSGAHRDVPNETKSFLSSTVNGDVDSSFHRESYSSSPTSTTHFAEMPLKLSHTDNLDSCSKWQSNQKDDNSSRDFSLKTLERRNSDETCALSSPSRGSGFKMLHLTESVSGISLENAEADNKIANGLPRVPSGNVHGVRCDATTVFNVEHSTEVLHVEKSAFNSVDQLVTDCLDEKSFFSLCRSFDPDNVSLWRLEPLDTTTSDALPKDVPGVSSASAVDCSGQTENEVSDVFRANRVLGTGSSAPDIFTARRGSWISISSQKDPTNRATRNCRNTFMEANQHESINFISNVSRRKRSCSSKPARSSIWGFLEDVAPHTGLDEVKKQGSVKARCGRGSRKSIKNQASKSSNNSSKKAIPPISGLKLKIKLGSHSYLNSTVTKVDAPASLFSRGTEICVETMSANLGEQGTGKGILCDENSRKLMTCQDATVTAVKLEKRDSESAEVLEKSSGDACRGHLGIPSVVVVEASGAAIEKSYMDPGTSPDSEVINPVIASEVGALHQENLHDSSLTASEDFASLGDVNRSSGSQQGKKARLAKPKSSKNGRGRQWTGDSLYSSENHALSSNVDASSDSRMCKEVSVKPLHLLSENGNGVSEEVMRNESSMEAKASCSPYASEPHYSKNLIPSSHKGHRIPKVSKSRAAGNEISKVSGSPRRKKSNTVRQKGNQSKSGHKSKVKENGLADTIVSGLDIHPESGTGEINRIGNTDTHEDIESADVANANLVSAGVMEQRVLPDSAWVRCDDCYKWRRIPVELADKIDGSCRWVCKDNMDETFADCSTPQEKSSSDINAELGLSEPEEDGYDGHANRKGLEHRNKTVRQASIFQHIDSNEFLHRRHKTQTIDEVMVCHCKPPPVGQLGCGDECLNRILNIECDPGTCPCGDFCSNQQFQNRRYAKMEWTRCGKKGYGLKMLENLSAGQFLIEYVGEVLDMQTYEKRQREYASMGQRHFYFMTLDGGEVIDARAKGNMGRFINHSCNPNCRTEKWMVNGEICIGLFALRNIKQGEEVTFDYNYVRVFGAAAKKCHCQSPHCRGYIGGDPLNAEVIVEDDSDEEYPEPVMLEDGESWDGLEHTVSRSSSFDGAGIQTGESVLKHRDIKDTISAVVGHLETTTVMEDSTDHSAKFNVQPHGLVDAEGPKENIQSSAQQPEVSLKTEVVTSEPLSTVQHDDTIKQKAMGKSSSSVKKLDPFSLTITASKLPSDIVDVSKKSKFDTGDGREGSSKTPVVMKISRSPSSVKKGKVGNPIIGSKVKVAANKYQVETIKPRKAVEGASNGRFETVEEKLNELLDTDGGISKRRDAAKGYLKLLLLTAASRSSANGEGIRRSELSMILDALLKTKSRAVLTDIINKNGLQLLHNIMKQHRRDFNKTPILRKLLKILEYLAAREILTLDHINRGPPCHGMESFRESILSFTEHDDKEVHQAARNFRDKWIPKHLRKPGFKDRDEGRMDSHRGSNYSRISVPQNHRLDQSTRTTESTDSQSELTTASATAVSESCPSSSSICQTSSTRIRKRKSRWDQPADPDSGALKLKEPKIEPDLEKKTGTSPEPVLCGTADHEPANDSGSGMQTATEDVPPGFSSPRHSSMASSTAIDFSESSFCLKCPSDVYTAHPQKRFNSRLPVSYGFPLPIMQQFGSAQAGSGESWVIAPGMAFHPFPPLPPPRNRKDAPTTSTGDSIRNSDANNATASTGYQQPDSGIPGADIQQTSKRVRDSSFDMGKKYCRHQRRKTLPWIRNQFVGNNHMCGPPYPIEVSNVKSEAKTSYFSHHPQHRNQH